MSFFDYYDKYKAFLSQASDFFPIFVFISSILEKIYETVYPFNCATSRGIM